MNVVMGTKSGQPVYDVEAARDQLREELRFAQVGNLDRVMKYIEAFIDAKIAAQPQIYMGLSKSGAGFRDCP